MEENATKDGILPNGTPMKCPASGKYLHGEPVFFGILAVQEAQCNAPRPRKKGNKRIRQNENKKTRLTYRVKRPPNVSEIKVIKKPPKWEEAPPYAASPPTSPGNRILPPD